MLKLKKKTIFNFLQLYFEYPSVKYTLKNLCPQTYRIFILCLTMTTVRARVCTCVLVYFHIAHEAEDGIKNTLQNFYVIYK